MQKIFEQKLGGSEDDAEKEAKYTWQKDEEAWYFDTILRNVNKVKFTGEHWLIGNKWGRTKMYKYEYLESSDPEKLKNLNDENKKSYDVEEVFYTTKEEVFELAFKYIKNEKDNAEKIYDRDFAALYAYKNDEKANEVKVSSTEEKI